VIATGNPGDIQGFKKKSDDTVYERPSVPLGCC